MKINHFILISSLASFNFYGQKSDYVVTKSLDTIYVDGISITDFKVKTKLANVKKQFAIDEIKSYFIAADQKHFERVDNTFEKKEPTKIDKYDYRQLENAHILAYKSRVKYKFLQRLTLGKVKLFVEEIYHSGSASSIGQAGFVPSTEKNYFLGIYDSKVEPMNYIGNNTFLKSTVDLTLTKGVYDLLKIYLIGNTEISTALDDLFLSKPIVNEKQIIELINEYNKGVELKKQ
jgi:hypothetical protein